MIKYSRNLTWSMSLLFLSTILYYSKSFIYVVGVDEKAEKVVVFVFNIVGTFMISLIQSFI